jgi:hypothetical protein
MCEHAASRCADNAESIKRLALPVVRNEPEELEREQPPDWPGPPDRLGSQMIVRGRLAPD